MAKRRAPGEGTLYFRKSDRRWCASIAFLDADGRLHRRVKYADSQAEGLLRLRELREKYSGSAPHMADKRVRTLGEYLDHWLQTGPKASSRATTVRSYASHVKQHIAPGLGRIRLDRLTPQHIQAWLGNLERADGMTRTRRRAPAGDEPLADLSPNTKRRIHATLRRALNQAVRWGLIAKNPAAGLELPEPPPSSVEPPSREEIRAFLTFVAGDRLEALYYVLVGVGLRRGEAMALRWRDVDLEAGTVSVQYTMHERASVYELLPAKTHASRAVLYMPDIVVRKLRDRAAIQDQERELTGAENWPQTITVNGKPAPNDLIFTRVSGLPLNPTAATRRFQKLLARAGLPHRRLHDYRHATATFLLEEGADIKAISGQLRHRSFKLTADTYTHFVPLVARRNAELLSRVLDPKEPPAGGPAAPPPSVADAGLADAEAEVLRLRLELAQAEAARLRSELDRLRAAAGGPPAPDA